MSVYDYNRTYTDVTQGFVAESTHVFRASLQRIEHCARQLSDEQLWWRPRPEMNSIANLMLHLSGNVGQWVVSSVANVPSTRNRPAEFAQRNPIPRDELLRTLQDAVQRTCSSIDSIKTSEQLLQPRRIQGNDTNLLTAIFHAASHFEGHTQEIISMTRQILGDQYKYLWQPTTPEQVSAK
jgi:uncharacterized protein DUF1572